MSEVLNVCIGINRIRAFMHTMMHINGLDVHFNVIFHHNNNIIYKSKKIKEN